MILFSWLLGAALGVLADRLFSRYQERTADRRSLSEWEQVGLAFGWGNDDDLSDIGWRRR